MSSLHQSFNGISSSYIGAMCASYRRFWTDYSQQDAADEIGCSREAVSKFERGRYNNSVIFLWYIKKGVFEYVPVEKWNGWDMGL